MEILFLGGLFANEMECEISKKTISGSIQYAAQKFQLNFIESLSYIPNVNLKVLSAPFIGTFPKEYKSIYFKGDFVEVSKNITYTYVSFLNIWGIRNYFRKVSLIKGMKEFISIQNKQKVIIVYSAHTPFLEAAVYAKKRDPNISICMIVPDLPQYMNLRDKRSKIYDFLKKIDIKIYNKLSDKIDSYILITEQMKDILNVGKKPYIVIEGIVGDIPILNKDSNQIKSVVYTGTLYKKFGIMNLIEAFSKIEDQNVVLKIAGNGDASSLIKEYAKRDNRIIYLGQLSNADAIRLQLEATVLVNPRPNDEAYTKYSFPFKTMEYLVSGNPVISFKLDGIPNEYDDVLIYFQENSIESIKAKLCEVLNLTDKERYLIGQRARNFIIDNKTPAAVGMKIYNLLNDNNKD